MTSPSSIAIGDLNNDGRVDVAVGLSSGSVGVASHFDVFLQNTSGELDPPISYAGLNTGKIKIGDFNGDGLLDIVGISWGSDSVDIFLQNSLGGFYSPISLPITFGLNGYDLDVGDVNNDGLTDIVVLSEQYEHVGVIIQRESGSFSPPVYYTLQGGPYNAIAVGDVNGDSLQDVAVAHGGDCPDSVFGVLYQNETGTLNPCIDYPTFGRSERIAIGDVNNDGRQDVVLQYGGACGWGYIDVYLQNENGELVFEDFYLVGSAYAPIIGDINGDGLNDIALHLYIGLAEGLAVFYQRKFEPEINAYPSPIDYGNVTIGNDARQTVTVYNSGAANLRIGEVLITGGNNFDFRKVSDGCSGATLPPMYACNVDIDFVPWAAGPKRASLQIKSNDPDDATFSIELYGNRKYSALFEDAVAFPAGDGVGVVMIRDMNNDGRNDVVGLAAGPPGYIYVLLQNESGSLDPPASYPTNGYSTSMGIGDLNNDGKNDIVVGNYCYNMEVFLQNESGGFDPPVTYMVEPLRVQVGDFNNDGLLDVASIPWGGQNDGGRPYAEVLCQNIGGSLNPPIRYYAPHGGYDDMKVGDINDDGLTDIVVMSGQFNYPNVNVLIQNAGGTFNSPIYFDLGTYELTSSVAVGDIDGDGMPDIVVTHGDEFPSITIFSLKNGMYLPVKSYSSSLRGPQALHIADVNNDGRQDVIVTHGFGQMAFGVFLQGEDGVLLPEELYPTLWVWSYEPQSFAVGDINSDGLPDVVFANTSIQVHYHSAGGIIHISTQKADFGTVLVGETSSQTLTLTNLGFTPLTLTGFTMGGLDSSEFALSNNTCTGVSLPSAGTCTLGIAFSPKSIGAKDATLTVLSDDPDTPQSRIVLAGVGTMTSYSKIIVLAPDGGEILPAGSVYKIRWGSPAKASYFKIQYYSKKKVKWTDIADNVSGNSYDWTVPTVHEDMMNCYIKIIGYNAKHRRAGAGKTKLPFKIKVAQ